MESEELKFLRDQVQRLNLVLSQYQERYPAILQGSGLQTGGENLPWLTDRNLMSPLLAEYDANLQVLRDQVSTSRSDQKELRSQVDKLVAENKRLTKDLKETLESQLQTLNVDNLPPSLDDDQLVTNLQHQLQMSLQEKESAMEMWQAAVQEVERLEQEVKKQQLNPRLHALEAQSTQIKGQYMQTVGELNTEISSLQEQLRQSKNELKASQIQVTDLRQTLEEMKKQLMRKEQEKSAMKGHGDLVGSKMDDMEKTISDLETTLQDREVLLSSIKKDKAVLEQKVVELQKKSTDFEQREYEAVLQVRDSVQMVENAMLEKDEALVREKQATEDVQRLQDAISKLLDEAGARTRQEVDAVKKQCNQNLSRLMEEIHTLELENSEKQSQIDRSLREKRAVESELEKIYQEGLVHGTKETGTIDDLNRRACNAERLKDEAMVKVDAITAQLRRLEIKHSQEKKQLVSEVSSLRERLEKLGLEFEGVNKDRVRLMEEMDGLRKKMQALTQEKDGAQRNFHKEMTLLERESKRKDADYEVKLQTLEDSHRSAMLELRQLLTSQQRMSAKWKEECQTITLKFEAKVSDLRSEIARHKKRVEELTKLLRDSRDKTADAEQMLAEYARNIKRMEERVREAENRAATAALQVSQHMARTRSLMTSQQGALTSSVKHGSGELAEPITLSDLATNSSLPKCTVHFADDKTSAMER